MQLISGAPLLTVDDWILSLETTCRITSSLPISGTSLRCFSQFRMVKLPLSVGTLLTRICPLRTFTRRLVALRTVHDSISTLEDHFTKLPLTPAMKRHVMSARMRYGQYLDEQKKESLNEQQRKKRKGV